MDRRQFLQLTAGAALSALPAFADTADTKARPNIIVILVDDMGFSDIGCYGSEIPTPNLDTLAQEGVRFSQFYNTGRCCPTRASVLTGLYSHQAGVGHMTEEHFGPDGKVLPGYSGRLNDSCVTIAEVLKGAGYFTAMAGKWHIGQNLGVTPWGRGFDRSLDSVAGGIYFDDTTGGGSLFLNGKNVGRTDDPLPKHWYSTDLWTEYSLKFIDEAHAAKKPFFLYLAHNAPHFPLQAPPEDIARWRGKYKIGWDKLREARYRKQQEIGLIDKDCPMAPRPEIVPAWDSLSEADKDHFDHIMAIYAATIEHMDKSVGDLVEGLRKRGELDNTLILFLSDNGGNAESGIRGRLEGDHPGDAKSTVFEGQSWATLSNTPLVRYKHYTDEGGISTPLIAHWPQGIPKARQGKFEKQPGHLIDIMATCVDIGGARYPADFKGKAIKPMEGVSLRPAFSGGAVARKNPIFWEHESNRAVRQGNWKIVAVADQPWRLYNMETDRTEQQDLAAAHPERVKELAAKWDAWAARANVLPLGGWRAPGSKNKNAGSKAKRFALKNGDRLERNKAPMLVGRGFTIAAKLESVTDTEGVILAQGGTQAGYTLFVKEKQLTFLVRTGDQTKSVQLPIMPGVHTVTASLTAKKVMLALDGRSATQDVSGLLNRQPVDGLDVGRDTAGAVGPYTTPFPFKGTIQSLELTFGK